MDLRNELQALLGATEVVELGGGHQSRVFKAARPEGGTVVAKVVEGASVERSDLLARIEVVAALARIDGRVCPPTTIDGDLVTELAGPEGVPHWVTGSEWAAGAPPDPSVPSHARTMGRGLALLHGAMRSLGPTWLPPVAALRAVPSHPAASGSHQLIHGDFRADNLRLDDDRMRIFDLDDCGSGPVALDVALSLYAVLFDSVVGDEPAVYHRFREHFLAGYVEGSGQPVDEAVVDRFVDLRVEALAVWLDDPSQAPVGIRTSTPGWQATLRSFVATHRAAR